MRQLSERSERPALPPYRELPVVDGKPARSSWGLWGERDPLGTLNLLTADRVRDAAGLVRTGKVFSLNWDLDLPDPPLLGRERMVHAVSWHPNDMGHDETLSGWNTQSSSQWDGFRHIRSVEHGFYSGLDDADHGMHHWAKRGIAGRAVLLDVGRWRESIGRPLRMDEPDPIEPNELLATAEAQQVQLQPGDILLVRTGWIGWYLTLDQAERHALAQRLQAPGLGSGEETAALLWDLHVAAVAADNPTLEAFPPAAGATPEVLAAIKRDPARLIEVFAHLRLLPLLGIPIGELFDLEALAADCRADGVWEGLFTSAPLNLRSGVASPPNALVIK